ncbi:MAG: DUF4325 domain-containing protein [Gemmatimonadetes bacterium]|nr:DUF4325 domain-containing protein [Candidatus Palauibacter rhopaloidicola]MDE2894370.1 DUF4325 domain-containing protein [Chloroflexota bacterium]
MNPGSLHVEREGGHIRIAGDLVLGSFRVVLAAMHQATQVKGFTAVKLDFSDAKLAFPGPMLAVLATCARLRDELDVDFTLIRPAEGKLRRLFTNANWAHLATPGKFERSTWQPTDVLPARRFMSPDEQEEIVSQINDAVLSSSAELTKRDLAAFGWTVFEVVDNVLRHADCSQGGLVQLSQYPARQQLEFVVADGGRGIPRAMRTTMPRISDAKALELSIERGVTSTAEGMGHGLFGTHQASSVGAGHFEIHSGYASIGSDTGARDESIPVTGTLVVVRLDYSEPEALWRALEHPERLDSADYVELRYEDATDDVLNFVVRKEADSVGSRFSGRSTRTKIEKLMAMYPNYPINVDFDGVSIVSSSFADEFLGKLFVRIGALRFTNAIRLRGVCPTVRSVVDQAILQRVKHDAENG